MPSAVLSLTPSTPDLCKKGSVWCEENAQACFADQQAFKWEISAFFKQSHLAQAIGLPFPHFCLPDSGVKALIKFIPLLLFLPLPQSTLNNSSPSLVFTAFKYLQTVVMSHSSSPPFLVVSLVYITYLALLIFLSKSIPPGPDGFCSSLSNSLQLAYLDLML